MQQNQKSIVPDGAQSFNTSEAEKYLGLGHGTLRVGRCNGTTTVPFYKLGKKVTYRKRDLDAYLESCRVDPQAA